jgi:hypothetical protein
MPYNQSQNASTVNISNICLSKLNQDSMTVFETQMQDVLPKSLGGVGEGEGGGTLQHITFFETSLKF